MNVYLTGIFWVVGAAVVCGGIGYLVRRFGWDEGRRDNNDAAGQVFTIVGGLHAVLVAFVLISLFDAVGTARDGSYTEADGLVSMTWAAEALPGDTGQRVQQLATAYATTVQHQEWPRLADGGTIPDTGWTQLDQLRRTIAEAQAGNDWENDRKTEAANDLWQVYQARQARLTDAATSGVGSVVWFALILGSIISVLLPNLFGGTRMAAHLVIVSTLAGTIALLLYAIFQLQNPFAGGASIQPDAFSSALARLG
ncbi:bestrophin-like domain [Amycolatopsis sp. NPDC004368]